MKIAIQDIPPEGLFFAFHGCDWLPGEVETVGEVQAELSLSRDRDRVLASGSFDLQIRQTCDRCLVDFILPLANSFKIDFEPETDEMSGREHHCRPEEMDTEVLTGTEIDIHELLRQQFYLAMPVKVLCYGDCKGLCGGCGSNLNQAECSCQQETSSAFDVLRTLLK